jgi:hypothetical protein
LGHAPTIERAGVLRCAGRTTGFPTSIASTTLARVSPPNLATARQRRYLRFLGVPTPPALTKKEARRLINKAKAAKKVHG